jgi:hypothetical protein
MSRSPIRIGALVCGLAVLASAQAPTGARWPLVNHDVRNSRLGTVAVPEGNGTCLAWSAGGFAPGEIFVTSGVLSADGSALYIVGVTPTDYRVHQVGTASGDLQHSFVLPLTGFPGTADPAVVHSPISNKDIVFVGVGGVLYALSLKGTGFYVLWLWDAPAPLYGAVIPDPLGVCAIHPAPVFARGGWFCRPLCLVCACFVAWGASGGPLP